METQDTYLCFSVLAMTNHWDTTPLLGRFCTSHVTKNDKLPALHPQIHVQAPAHISINKSGVIPELNIANDIGVSELRHLEIT